MSGSLVKIIVGVLLIVVSAWWIVQGSSYIQPLKDSVLVTSRPALADLMTLVNGGLPPFLGLIGLLIVWLEWDGLKIRKELSQEKPPEKIEDTPESKEEEKPEMTEEKAEPSKEDNPKEEKKE